MTTDCAHTSGRMELVYKKPKVLLIPCGVDESPQSCGNSSDHVENGAETENRVDHLGTCVFFSLLRSFNLKA